MDLAKHVVNLSRNGTLAASGQFATSLADIAAIFDALEKSGRKSLTLHFHGGLLPEDEGLALARSLFPTLWDEAETYPVFFVWETGAPETLAAALGRIHQTKLFKKLAGKLLKVIAQKLGAPEALADGIEAGISSMDEAVAAEAPVDARAAEGLDALIDPATLSPVDRNEELELARDVDDDAEVNAIMAAAAAALAPPEPPERESDDDFAADEAVAAAAGPSAYVPSAATSFLDQAVIEQWQVSQRPADESMAADEALFSALSLGISLAKVLAKVVMRFIKRSDHGVWPTIVEELMRAFYLGSIGAIGWDQMKINAKNAYLPELVPTDPQRGGSRFLDALAHHLDTHPTLAVNLIGHSAGALHVAHLLRARVRPQRTLKFARVAILAPACDFDLFAQSFLAADADIGQLRLYNLTDAAECADTLIRTPWGRWIYPRSLLYLISGVLENEGDAADHPIVGMQRFFSDDRFSTNANVAATRNFLGRRQDSTVWCPGSDAGFALHGGQFEGRNGPNTDATTLHSLAAFVRGT